MRLRRRTARPTLNAPVVRRQPSRWTLTARRRSPASTRRALQRVDVSELRPDRRRVESPEGAGDLAVLDVEAAQVLEGERLALRLVAARPNHGAALPAPRSTSEADAVLVRHQDLDDRRRQAAVAT